MASRIQKVETDARTIRAYYAQAQIEERYARGELTMGVRRSGKPDPKARQPRGTLSQIVQFNNRHGMMICLAHQYLRADGTLGASGQRDPKYLRMGSTVYVIAAARKDF